LSNVVPSASETDSSPIHHAWQSEPNSSDEADPGHYPAGRHHESYVENFTTIGC